MAFKLTQPEVISDLLLLRLSRLLSVASVPIVRLCEGQFGITRRPCGPGFHYYRLN
jgi:hypothetical protein